MGRPLHIKSLREAYKSGTLTPIRLIEDILARMEDRPGRNVWIHRLDEKELMARANELEGQSPDERPLYGIPFAIKDNIDLKGHPTTAACREYAYTPQRSAYVVDRLLEAGAIAVGKTNLDQFATGLVGTRSPYGACANALNEDYVSGGSSSGSAVSVALGHVSFSLGTDTAGSGRVPASFNNVIGLKPTRGVLSASGVVPACRSLDTISIFAPSVDDARTVFDVACAFDETDAFARPNTPGQSLKIDAIGVPRARDLEFFGNKEAEALFAASIERLQKMGVHTREVDMSAFLEAAKLLYEGPWVAERYIAIEDIMRKRPDAVFPVTRKIIEAGTEPSAVDAFKAQYRLAEFRRAAEEVLDQTPVLMTPTAGSIYTIAEVNADPVRLNSDLGYYTNYMNLLDLCGLTVPSGFFECGVGFGVTFVGPAFHDKDLCSVGRGFLEAGGFKTGLV